MGTPLPESVAAVLCSNCWGPGKPFGLEPTPQMLRIQLFGLEEGEFFDSTIGAEALVPTLLFQTENPCVWSAETSTLAWLLELSFNETRLFVVTQPFGDVVFVAVELPPCTKTGLNREINPIGNFAFNGFFELTISKVIP